MQTPPVPSAVEGKIIAVQFADLHLIFSTIVPFTQLCQPTSPRPPMARLSHPAGVDVRGRDHSQDWVSTKLRLSVARSMFRQGSTTRLPQRAPHGAADRLMFMRFLSTPRMGAELPATSCHPRLLGEVGKRLRSLPAVQLVEQSLRKRIVDLTPEPSQLNVPDAPASCRDRSSNEPALSLSHTFLKLQRASAMAGQDIRFQLRSGDVRCNSQV